MASSLQITILIALISTIAIQNSTGRGLKSEQRKEESKSDIENHLRNLCALTNKKSKKCWKIIEPALWRFTGTNSRNVAGVVFDLAIERSGGIKDELVKLLKESGNDELRMKYHLCFENYSDAYYDLVAAKRNMDSDSYYRNIPGEINEAKKQLKACKQQFRKESFDPAHIRNRNKEFGVYMETVRVASTLFIGDKKEQGQ